jgi:hypothetical protein
MRWGHASRAVDTDSGSAAGLAGRSIMPAG